MIWRKLPYWLKGGIIGFCIYFIIGLIDAIVFLTGNFSPAYQGIMQMTHLYFFVVLSSVFSNYQMTCGPLLRNTNFAFLCFFSFSIIYGFIIGTIIGWITGLILKSKK